MERYTAKIIVSNINKDKIVTRTYKNKEGIEVIVKELEIELVPLRESKLVAENAQSNLWKVGFIAERSVKNEKGEWVNGNTLGDIGQWVPKDGQIEPQQEESQEPEIKEEDIPF